MKRAVLYIIICIIICGGFIALLSPYMASASLCRLINNGDTEYAVKKINSMKDLNRGTAPVFLGPLLNVFDSSIDLPLVAACRNCNYEVAELLMEKGADPNRFFPGGMTPIEAVFAGNHSNELEMLKLLEKNGADVTLSVGIDSPMIAAARKMVYAKDETRVAYLAECVSFLSLLDPQKVDEKGYSILYYAVLADNKDLIVQLLEQEKQLIGIIDKNGQTVLFVAVKNQSANTVSVLLDYGVDKSVFDNSSKTALDYAVEAGNEEIIALLKG